jgi:acetyl esterase/lipase
MSAWRTLFFSFLIPGGFLLAAASTPGAALPSDVVPLWPGVVPGALADGEDDRPTLTAYLPDPARRNGATLLILPGGAYMGLAEHEGKGYAERFVAEGIACYVLKYRLGSKGYRHPVMLQDAARALRTVRAWAQRDGLDPARVGVIGSSAGGHLASTLATHFDLGRADAPDPIERLSSRADVVILCYPVITLKDPYAHAGSRRALLGEKPSAELIASLSNEDRVTAETPPTFLWHTVEDRSVPVENSLLFAEALRRAGVPFALHVFERGAHGLGMGRPGRPAPPWYEPCLYWLRERQFLSPAKA